MIPYEALSFKDWDWYWGQSILIGEVDGEITALQPVTRVPVPVDPDEAEWRRPARELAHPPQETLEEMGKAKIPLKFTRVDNGAEVEVPALTPFMSPNWITFDPPLGYFVVDGQLVLATNTAPRTRYKGLHYEKVAFPNPVDTRLIPKTVRQRIQYSPARRLNMETLATLIVDRIKNPLPYNWGRLLRDALALTTTSALVLDHDIAAVVLPKTGTAILLQAGLLLGTVKNSDSQKLVFTPPNKPTTKWERSFVESLNRRLQA